MKPKGQGVAPVTREGAVGAFKLLMIVLAAAIFWQAAVAVNAEFHARRLVTAPPFLRGASRLLVGTETTAPFPERLAEFWAANHRLVALVAMLIGMVLLVGRYLILGRALDFLYIESEARGKRIYSGFLANIMLMLAQAGALYAVVFFSRADYAAAVAPAMLVMFGLNLIWVAGILLTARGVERDALRGLWYLGGTTLAAVVVLLAGVLAIEAPPADLAAGATQAEIRGSLLIALSAAVAVTLCLADGYVQTRLYRRRRQVATAD